MFQLPEVVLGSPRELGSWNFTQFSSEIFNLLASVDSSTLSEIFESAPSGRIRLKGFSAMFRKLHGVITSVLAHCQGLSEL